MTLPVPAPTSGMINEVVLQFLQSAEVYETREFFQMAQAWLSVEQALQAEIELLAMELAGMRANGKLIDQLTLLKMERYQSLLIQAAENINRFYKKAGVLISEGQEWHIVQGIAKGKAEIEAVYKANAIYKIAFDMLPTKAMDHMIGKLGDGSPLADLLRVDYQSTARDIGQLLVEGLAKGLNPRDTAMLMSDYMKGNLDRAMLIARTEQIRSFRTANVAQYQQSGVVETYTRRSAFQERSCMACISLDGKVYPVTEQFSDHPGGRCFSTPNVKGLAPIQTMSGQSWFNTQSEATQRNMMGPEYYSAWKNGKFQLSDLAEVSHSDVWGEQIRVTPLSKLAGA